MTQLPPPPKMARKASGAGKKHSSKRRRSVKNTKKKKDTAKHEYDKWVKVRAKLHEADVERKRQIKTVADFLKEVLPSSSTFDQNIKPNLDASHLGAQTELRPATLAKRYIKSELPATPAKRHIAYKTTPITSTSSDVIYETSTPPPSIEKGDDDDDDVAAEDPRVEPHVLEFGAKTVGELASPYVSSYLYESKRRYLDTEFGIRKVGNGSMTGDTRVGENQDGNIHIKEVDFPATKGLWELLMRKKVNKIWLPPTI